MSAAVIRDMLCRGAQTDVGHWRKPFHDIRLRIRQANTADAEEAS